MSILTPWLRVAVAMTAVGWGANHFAGLLPVYRIAGHTEAFVSVAVGIYALGLIPALFVVAVVGDRVDHRAPVRLAVVLSAGATMLLALGAEADVLLHVGRFVAGAATGIALAPGTAWLMDLSRASPGAGARRATVALSLGFGGGPFVVGLVGQWSPYPEVTPYGAHLVLSVLAMGVVWTAPVEPHPTEGPGPGSWAGVRGTVGSREFLSVVPATAPWVFGTAATAFAIAPGVVTIGTLPVAGAAVVIGVTIFGGIGIQPLAKRLEHRAPGLSLALGLACTVVGLLVCAWAFASQMSWLLFVIAVVLGAAYGLLLVGGLSRVEMIARPADRSRVNAVFYTLAYLGFAAPYAFVLATDGGLGPSTVMLAGAAVAALTLVVLPRPRKAGVGANRLPTGPS